jgi:hypothetical protein
MPDLDEPLNVDLEPEDALRILLESERREAEPERESDKPDDEPTR